MSYINTVKFKALITLVSVLFSFNSSFAHVCTSFLTDIENKEVLLLNNRDVELVRNSDLSISDRMGYDKQFIDLITELLIQDRTSLRELSAPVFTQTSTESKSVIAKLGVDIFLRYEDFITTAESRGNSSLETLTVNHHLAHAILIFNNHDNPRRADDAVNYVKAKISPRDQFKSTAVLLNLIDFYLSAGRSAEANRVGVVYRSIVGL